MSLFTVAIPTYNRLKSLAALLQVLTPQLNENWTLLIIDNASDQVISEELEIVLPLGAQLRIVRNPFNVGGNANILRTLELCESRWIWVLGDDDIPSVDAVVRIEGEVMRYPDAVFINFYHDSPEFLVTGRGRGYYNLPEFLAAGEVLSAYMFISSNVMQAPRLRANLRWGYQYLITCAPFLVVLCSLSGEVQCIRSDGRILASSGHGRDQEGGHYSPVTLLLGIGLLLDLPVASPIKAALKKLVAASTQTWKFRSLFKAVLIDVAKTRHMGRAAYVLSACSVRFYGLSWRYVFLPRSAFLWRGVLSLAPALMFLLRYASRLGLRLNWNVPSEMDRV